MISDKKSVQDFLSLLSTHGINHVIITPGSRNAPFSISLIDHQTITSHSIIDERSAGFVALGMAQQLGKPVVLICTSGTAVLNFAPAIAEAYYQRVPLLIVTADRPMEWIDQGEGQSIRQKNVFANYIKASYEIAEEAKDIDLIWYNVRIMDEAMRLCVEGVRGPVHINFPLRESLYRTIDQTKNIVKSVVRSNTLLALTISELDFIKNKLLGAEKIMLLAGQMPPDKELLKSVRSFAQNSNVIVFTEAHSNLADESFVTTVDRLIMAFDEQQKQFIVPDILITIGQNIISRKIKEILRNGNTEHWHIDISGEGLDTMKHLSRIIPLSPSDFFSTVEGFQMNIGKLNQSLYKETVLGWNKMARNIAVEYSDTAPWSDLKVFHLLSPMLPSDSDLQMGNSSVVRYILLSDSKAGINYFGNRGVAGIDGCTSTAIGAVSVTKRITTLISGDIGFFYDSNAFWNNLNVPQLKVIVVNNGGGGIFRIIEGPNTTGKALDKFFETAHERKTDKLAAMYDVPYLFAHDEDSFISGLHWLYENPGLAILEVGTPRLDNDVVLKGFFRKIKENVSASN